MFKMDVACIFCYFLNAEVRYEGVRYKIRVTSPG
jgi:hypothetical protein